MRRLMAAFARGFVRGFIVSVVVVLCVESIWIDALGPAAVCSFVHDRWDTPAVSMPVAVVLACLGISALVAGPSEPEEP